MMKRVGAAWQNLPQAKRDTFKKKAIKLQKQYELDVAADQQAQIQRTKKMMKSEAQREAKLEKEARRRQLKEAKSRKKKKKNSKPRSISGTEKRRRDYNKKMQARCSEGKKEMLRFFARVKSVIEPFVTKDVLQALPALSQDEIAAASAADIDTETAPSISQPESIVNGQMRAYQLKSLEWLLQMHDRGMSAILGDEMGLGKTLQTIAFLSALKFERELEGVFLVVVPLSVVSSWMSEFRRWSPEMRVLRVHGSGACGQWIIHV